MSNTLETFIAQQTDALNPLNTRIAELSWQVSTTGQPEYEQQLGEAVKQARLFFADKARYQALRDLLNTTSPTQNELLLRQAKLMYNGMRANQISPDLIERMTELEIAIQSQFVKFRASVGGQPMADNDLRQILKESDDVALRQEAWQASKQVGAQVAEMVRQLARLRNQAAHQAGFANYYTMRLEIDELSEAEVFGLFDELKRGTDAAWLAYKKELDAGLAQRFNIGIDQLRPWHYGDPFFQEPQPSDVNLDAYFADKDLERLTLDYFGAIGLEVGDILERSDLYERPGKEQHAFCTHIDRSGDVRVLCNNRPDERWMETMLHEFGHAVYDKYLDMSLPYLLRDPAHTLTTEAIAILQGDLVNDAAWLKRYAGVDAPTAQHLEAKLTEAKRAARLIFSRWVFVMVHFERSLYQDPDQDLNTLWWRLVTHFQNVTPPASPLPKGEGPGVRADWAAKIHIGIAPVYYHNYLLGAMIAAQLRDHMLNEVVAGSREAYVNDKRIGQFMVQHLFQPGATRDWHGWLHHATGEGLSAETYIKKLSAHP
jgi:peptidyl-dipeptidase A